MSNADVETIAKALWGEYGGAYCLGSLHWDEATDHQRAECLGDARNALAAIAPRLKAEGMREARSAFYRCHFDNKEQREAAYDVLTRLIEATGPKRADALDPPKETK